MSTCNCINTTTCQNYYVYRVMPIFNKLPIEVQIVNDKIFFKSKIKQIIFQKHN